MATHDDILSRLRGGNLEVEVKADRGGGGAELLQMLALARGGVERLVALQKAARRKTASTIS